MEELKYLGHLVTGHGIKPDPNNIKAIKDMATPTNKKELLSFT